MWLAASTSPSSRAAFTNAGSLPGPELQYTQIFRILLIAVESFISIYVRMACDRVKAAKTAGNRRRGGIGGIKAPIWWRRWLLLLLITVQPARRFHPRAAR